MLTAEESSTRKLTPYEFYLSIGKPKYIVAPMVDHSDLSYRMLTRKYGADLAYTQMFSSNSFVQSKDERNKMFTTCPEDRPLIVQFAGHDPQVLLEAALLVQDRCDAVDINLGCPQGIAKRGRYGAFLMEELEVLSSIVSTLSAGLKIPVTCKTRIYRNDFERSVKLCETLVTAGASMLTIHGRSREEKGNLVAGCDWPMIARLKAHFGDRVPIIANGGIECLDDIHNCLDQTGADGVMTSEAILENPALFARNLNEKKEYRTLVDLAEEYLHMAIKYPGSQIKTTRNHMMKFFYKYFIKHPDFRERTAMTNSNEGFQLIINELRSRINDSDNDYKESWYKRYRNADSDEAHNGHHVTQGDDKTFINWQTIALDKQKDKFWSTVEEDTDGIFDCLGMFNE
mmetsp:Transcript_35034/g.33303  ORF Transcript_35034/g.33303 Transcript_35034/m.33303 type:complete len:400 (+) Transcript_35034:120-1319(+)|eukprot:CAMPEP_0119033114 /NCGR_PEP_ID=MMETSP1177-20130426/101_1 /TAXON_ID=2985 /ORGANISM="Ochromonas sp, Strain CCMP1899" /LENGTH=399 /DNA_ID=CAMNT_0006989587 /DNA_START=110 /DNA_END=1309 /DNA_ORIENTATION=-